MKETDVPQHAARSAAEATPPFSRPFAIERVHRGHDIELTIEADANERAALATLDGLQRVDRLKAHVRIAPLGAPARDRTIAQGAHPFPRAQN